MTSVAVRVFLVEDFKPWRNSVRSMLKEDSKLQIVGEASDGLESVQKAQDLKPDLILLDIGLPNLNGIEVATRVRQIVPSVRIIFLTLNRDPDVVRRALSNGTRGYVLKADALTELAPAIEAVLNGKKFLSRSLAGCVQSRFNCEPS